MKLGIRSWIGSCSLLALLYISDAGATDYMSNTEGANHLGRSSQVSSSYRSIDASSREENNANERQRAITDDEKEQLKELFYADDFDLEKVENFLKDKGIDFGLNKTKGSEEITIAAGLGNPDLVRLLMNYGADINANKHPLGRLSPLRAVVMVPPINKRNVGAMRCLVECGADVENCDGDSIIRAMIEHWPNGFGKEDIEFMVKHGADINKADSEGNTPLIIASSKELDKGEDLIKCLIDNGADINKADSKGNTPLIVASSKGCFGTVKLLLSMRNVENTIFLLTACRNKHPLSTEQIVSRTKTLVNINARNKKGKTALDFAQEKLDWAQKELKKEINKEQFRVDWREKEIDKLQDKAKGRQKALEDEINQKNKEIERIKETIKGIEKTYDILLRHGAKTKEKINLELRDIYFNDAVSILS
ncbi:MAG: ankyrin repeat domain-containing protein [Alphaproteobacteria bacterium]|nr:ankyrin repeat domain-containing protein [Alphaproteobacteria bacterium]